MQYYIPTMLPEYVEVEPDVFQPYSDATVAGWRNEQRLATQQGKHQRAGVTQMVLLADKLQIAESVPLYSPARRCPSSAWQTNRAHR